VSGVKVDVRVATCWRCGSSIFETEGYWRHRDAFVSRGCRKATFNAETGYYDDALGDRFLAAPSPPSIRLVTVEIPAPTPPVKALVAIALDDMEE
jgi:hypothetical protein